MSSKFGFCRTKPLLITLATIGMLISVTAIASPFSTKLKLFPVAYACYSSFMIFVAIKNELELTKLARQSSFVMTWMFMIPVIMLPLLLTGREVMSVASSSEMFDNASAAEIKVAKFQNAALFAALEIFLVIAIGYQYLIYSVISTLWFQESDIDKVLNRGSAV